MQKKSSSGIGKLLYGIGGLSVITESAFLLLFLPWVRAFQTNEIALLVACAAGIALPVFVMPFCYALINGNTAISTGRYHLYMTASALLSTLSIVLLLGVGVGNPVRQAFALFGLLFVHSLCTQIFSYTYFAVGQRFDTSGKATTLRDVFGICSFLLSALLIVIFSDGTRDSIRAILSLCAVISVLSVFSVYMTTAVSMPEFIRMEPYHKRKMKESYKRFLAPMQNGAVRLFAVAAFLFFTGVSVALTTVPACAFAMFGRGWGYKAAVLAVTVLIAPTAVIVYAYGRNKKNKRCSTVSVVVASVLFISAISVIAGQYVPFPSSYNAGVGCAFSVCVGIVIGTVFAVEHAAKEHAARLCDCTPGKYGCLYACIATLGAAFGLALAAAVDIIATHVGTTVAVTVTCGLCAVLFTVGAALHRTAYANKFVNGPTPDAKEETTTCLP